MINPNYVESITGRLVRDPDYRTTDRGTSVCHFTIAVDLNKGKTKFRDCTAFYGTAEFVGKYFSKGKWISVVGSPDIDEFTGKDGKARSKDYLVVEGAGFCGSKADAPAVRNEDGTLDIEVSEEELPF